MHFARSPMDNWDTQSSRPRITSCDPSLNLNGFPLDRDESNTVPSESYIYSYIYLAMLHKEQCTYVSCVMYCHGLSTFRVIDAIARGVDLNYNFACALLWHPIEISCFLTKILRDCRT